MVLQLPCSTADFCLWSSPKPNEIIADTEGETVAYCSKPGHGTRLIPAGALTGVQYMITPAYRQVVGFIDQRLIDLQSDDFGGELDPDGADLVSLFTRHLPQLILFPLAWQPLGWYSLDDQLYRWPNRAGDTLAQLYGWRRFLHEGLSQR
jgi:hypothetical protein